MAPSFLDFNFFSFSFLLDHKDLHLPPHLPLTPPYTSTAPPAGGGSTGGVAHVTHSS